MTNPIVILKRLYPQPNDKALWRLHLAISALPLTWALLMCVYALYTRLSIGHWPRPMVESVPQNVFSQFLEASTEILYMPTMYSLLIWLPFLIWRWKNYTLHQRFLHIGLYAIGTVACCAFAAANPSQFFDWWED